MKEYSYWTEKFVNIFCAVTNMNGQRPLARWHWIKRRRRRLVLEQCIEAVAAIENRLINNSEAASWVADLADLASRCY